MSQSSTNSVVSVITVVFNGASYIEKTVQSVINQTYEDLEYIVIDGGSTDGTLDILEKYRNQIKHLVSEKDRGIYDAMNKGLKLATGRWVNFLNGGDFFFNDQTVESILSSIPPHAYFVYGESINVYQQFQKHIKPLKISKASLRKSLGLCHQAVFAAREVAPFYDLGFSYKAEYNWVIEIVYNLPPSAIFYYPKPVVYYSLGGFSEKGMVNNLIEFMKLTRKKFGIFQLLANVPIYLKVLLRFIKYKIVHYE